MANYIATDTDLGAVADAIRTKGGTSTQLVFPQGFVDAIDAIEAGEEYFVVPSTGCIYPKVLDQTITGFNARTFNLRWAYCPEMTEATIRGFTAPNNITGAIFSANPKLEKISLPDFSSSNSYVIQSCGALKRVQLGSVGKAVTSLSVYALSGCTNSELVVTVYVKDTATLPLTNQPWGATNATIVYRSSTTGEVLTV